MTAAVKNHIEAVIGSCIQKVVPVGGGCIANASRVTTAAGDYFVKWGNPAVAATFDAEAAGLQALKSAHAPLIIPDVISCDTSAGCLVLSWIEQGRKTPSFSADFGSALAQLHRSEADRYGFSIDNFIGKTSQNNDWCSSWVMFFREMRLDPQVNLARSSNLWRPSWDGLLRRLYVELPNLMPDQPEKSLLHGDLWSGNYLVAKNGQAALIDPACYYGHREADLAMTELFGGFDDAFYDAYQNAWPLEPGYENRRAIYNLYHLLNHLNIFGSSYAAGVEKILSRYK